MEQREDNDIKIAWQHDSYMKRSITNYILNIKQKHAREKKYLSSQTVDELDEEDIHKYLSALDIYDAENGVVIKDMEIEIYDKRLRRILFGLSKREKTVLILRTAYDLDYDEISSLLGISVKSAKNYKHEALKKARANIKNDGSDTPGRA